MIESVWPTKRIDEVCEKPQYGFTASSTTERVGPQFLRITDLREGGLDWEQVPYCIGPASERERFRVKHGDLVVARIGATTGRASLVLNPPEAVFASYLIRLRAKAGLNPFFLYFFTKSRDYWQWVAGNKGNNLKGGVNASLLTEIEVPMAPEPEQERIAAVLWKVQRAIEVEDKLIATATELKWSVMHQLFTCGLRGEPQKESEIGAFPESWNPVQIRTVGELVAGGTPSRTVEGYWNGGTIPWVKTGEVNYCLIECAAERITEEGLRHSAAKILPEGTLLIAMYGQGVTRGKVAILGIKAATNQACVGLIPYDDEFNIKYLYHYLTFSYERLRSLSHGAQQQNLNAELIRDIEFPLPDDEQESKEIAGILDVIDRKISLHERKRATLQELFKTLLYKLMTGEIRVTNLDIDTSEVTQF